MRFLYLQLRTNIAALMSTPYSLLFQMLFMMLNNLVIILSLFLFYSHVPSIGGSTQAEHMFLVALHMLLFGIIYTFFAGYDEISLYIDQARLDSFLLSPGGLLMQLFTSKLSPSAVGDLATGIVLLLYFFPTQWYMPQFFLPLIFCCITGVITWLGIMLSYHSLAFYISGAQKIAEGGLQGMLGSGLYPQGIFEGTWFRFALYTIFPTFFIVFAPLKLIVHHFDWSLAGILLGGALGFFALGYWVFYTGLRRYESGNAIQMRYTR